jgi:hypothetical protein
MTGGDMVLIKDAEQAIAAILRKLEQETNSVVMDVIVDEQTTQTLSESYPSIIATVKVVLRQSVERWRE